MDQLTYARAQMGSSLAFHIVFAAAGVALPLFMVIADALWMKTRDRDYLEIAKRMAKGTAILFAVGAVSGTVLSFELGLLWPSFMGTFGEVVGLPFALEGFAFFTEAICLGIYLYGRDKIPPRLHLASGIGVAVSGAASAFFVTLVNATMNLPRGFVMQNGQPTQIDPIAAMFSAPWATETTHVILSSYQATAFALVGIHAFMLLRRPANAVFRKALGMSLAVACAVAIAQPISGHFSAQHIAHDQPIKLAASEAHFETGAHAPLRIGGLPDEQTGTVSYALDIPSGLSILAFEDPDAVVKGLNDFPRDEWPPVASTHLSFQIMVGTGSLMALFALVTAFITWRKKRVPDSRRYLMSAVLMGPLGLIALEAGWFVTELGRQPWIMHGAMRVKDAVTPFPHLAAPFWMFTLVYLFLAVSVVVLLIRQLRATEAPANEETKEVAHAH